MSLFLLKSAITVFTQRSAQRNLPGRCAILILLNSSEKKSRCEKMNLRSGLSLSLIIGMSPCGLLRLRCFFDLLIAEHVYPILLVLF